MKKSSIDNIDFTNFVKDIKQKILSSQYEALKAVNKELIDLLLYHRRLKSLIAIELKIGKFKPEYAGKINFYLSALNDTVKLPSSEEIEEKLLGLLEGDII